MIAHVVAIAANNVIGNENKLLWHIPEDLKHFKKLTMGKVVVMGRKTWESIPDKYRPLPNRKNVVVTRNESYEVPDGVEVFHSIDGTVNAFSGEDVMIIGGGEIYRATMNMCDRLYVTHIEKHFEGDALYPEIDMNVWEEVEREQRDGFAFVTYSRA